MASIQPRGSKWQLRVKHALLPKPFFSTFDNEAEARAYGDQLEALLSRGIVPMEMVQGEKRGENPKLSRLISQYLAGASFAPTDKPTLLLLAKPSALGDVRLLSITSRWADDWVSQLKTVDHLAPGTIRKRVECLARVVDWHWRLQGGAPPANPLRLMPRGYSLATEREAGQMTGAGKQVKRDVQRDRRLSAAELLAIRAALRGEPRVGRERALVPDPAFALLFELIVNTGLRLSEAYSLRVDQVDHARKVINVEGSKGHRGLIKPRMVPLVPELRAPLANWCAGRVGLLFPFWDGSPEDKKRATGRLSHRFATLFDYAQVSDFTEHDTRHEATCRWFELRQPGGHWVFSEVEVCKIMGWSDTRMALRYASLRGEDLSARLG